jgi:hypothetical protein
MVSVRNWSGLGARVLRLMAWFGEQRSFWPPLLGSPIRRLRSASGALILRSVIGATNGSLRGSPGFTVRRGPGDLAPTTKKWLPTFFGRFSKRSQQRGASGPCDPLRRRPARRRVPWRACSHCSVISRTAPKLPAFHRSAVRRQGQGHRRPVPQSAR